MSTLMPGLAFISATARNIAGKVDVQSVAAYALNAPWRSRLARLQVHVLGSGPGTESGRTFANKD